MKERINWCECPVCGHKLFKNIDANGAVIEIKCHSCKSIVKIKVKGGKAEDGREAN